jgi:hypothetical protein
MKKYLTILILGLGIILIPKFSLATTSNLTWCSYNIQWYGTDPSCTDTNEFHATASKYYFACPQTDITGQLLISHESNGNDYYSDALATTTYPGWYSFTSTGGASNIWLVGLAHSVGSSIATQQCGDDTILQDTTPTVITNDPVITFLYPTDATTTPPFSPWIFSVVAPNASDTYQISVHWQQLEYGTGILGGNGLWPNANYFQIFGDTSVQFQGTGSAMNIPVARPSRDLNYTYDKFNEDLWTATAYLRDVTAGNIVATSSINFTLLRYGADYGGAIGAVGTTTYYTPGINASGTLITNSSTNNFTAPVDGGVPLRNASSSNGCTPAADWTDVGGGISYGLCTATYNLFTPNDAYTTDIENTFSNIQQDFPFSAAYSVLNGVAKAAVQSASSTTSTLSLPLWGTNIPVLSNNSLSDFVGSSSKDTIFKVEDGVAWVGSAFSILGIVF